MALPSSIPNLEVKHIIADNTAGFPGGNVGRCQLFRIFMKLYLSLTLLGYGEAFFYGCRIFMRCVCKLIVVVFLVVYIGLS